MEMSYQDTMKKGMRDELTKIAGYLRAGRRPFKASTLLKKTGTMLKESAVDPGKVSKMKGGTGKYLAVAGLGALGYDQLRKAKRDYQTGRAMRLQNGY